MEELTEVKLLEVLKDYAKSDAEPLLCWRDFRGKYPQNCITGNSANEREENFKNQLVKYRRFPVTITLNLRVARIKAFRQWLSEEMLTLEVPELEVEEWCGYLQAAMQDVSGIKVALANLRKREPLVVREMLEEAERLWPGRFKELTDED